jgi:hypothetical protein
MSANVSSIPVILGLSALTAVVTEPRDVDTVATDPCMLVTVPPIELRVVGIVRRSC